MAAPPDVPGLRKPIQVTIITASDQWPQEAHIPRILWAGPLVYWICRECLEPFSAGVVDTISEACDAGGDHLRQCPAVHAATARLLAAIHDHVAEDVMPCCGRGPDICLCAMEES